MTLVRLLPVVVSALLMGAHFSRADNIPLTLLSVGLPLLLLLRRPWAARLVQAALLLGSLEWLRTLIILVIAREAADQAWLRLIAILGSVALFTAASTLVFRNPALRQRYSLNS